MVSQIGLHTLQVVGADNPSVADTERTRARMAGPADLAAPADDQPTRSRLGEIPAVDQDTLDEAVKDMAAAAQVRQRALEFSIDEGSGRTVIKVIDKETEAVMRQIPSEEVLELSARLRRGDGLLVNVQA